MRKFFHAAVMKARSVIEACNRPVPSTLWSNAPDSAYEEFALRLLRERGASSLDELVDRVASEAMRAEQVRGGWNLDISVWGPSLYRREATRAIRRMVESSRVLACDASSRLAVPSPAVAGKPS